NPNASAQRCQKTLQGGRISAIAAQDLQVQRNTALIGGHRQEHLRPIRTMVAAVSVLADALGTLAFKIDAGQIIEHQGDTLGEALLVKLLFHPDPPSVQLIHRGRWVGMEKQLYQQSYPQG